MSKFNLRNGFDFFFFFSLTKENILFCSLIILTRLFKYPNPKMFLFISCLRSVVYLIMSLRGIFLNIASSFNKPLIEFSTSFIPSLLTSFFLITFKDFVISVIVSSKILSLKESVILKYNIIIYY